MPIIYHGDEFGTEKIDPRLMIHPDSWNYYGIGIYFTTHIEDTEEYGPYVCSIDTKGLKIVDFDKPVTRIISRKKMLKYVKDIHKKIDLKGYYHYLRKREVKMRGGDSRLPTWLLENLEDNWELMTELMIYDESGRELKLYEWQMFFWTLLKLDSYTVKIFVDAWNKNIQIDGFYINSKHKKSSRNPGNYDEYCIIQTNVKVTPVNF